MEQNEKKNMTEKKKKKGNWNGLLPILAVKSRYNVLYRDKHGLGARHGWAGV